MNREKFTPLCPADALSGREEEEVGKEEKLLLVDVVSGCLIARNAIHFRSAYYTNEDRERLSFYTVQ